MKMRPNKIKPRMQGWKCELTMKKNEINEKQSIAISSERDILAKFYNAVSYFSQ